MNWLDRYRQAAQLLESHLARIVTGEVTAHRWDADGGGVTLTIAGAAGPEQCHIDAASGAISALPRNVVTPPTEGDPATLRSPDGTRAVFVRDHDLWLRDAQGERALTHDGVADFAYGALPEQSTRLFAASRAGNALPPCAVLWSPDGRYLIGERLDQRGVAPYPFLESVPQDGSFRPVVRSARMAMLGEPGPVPHPFLIDVARGGTIPIVAGEGWVLDPLGPLWCAGGTRLFLLGERDDGRAAGLFEIDLATGVATARITETQATPVFLNGFDYQAPNVALTANGDAALWYSERSGRGTLYRYDLTADAPPRALYDGAGVVGDLLAVDEARGVALATITGDAPGDDPYRRDLFALPLTGGAAQRLTDPALDHALTAPLAPRWLAIAGVSAPPSPVSPDGRLFLDRAGSVERPTVTTLRRTSDGSAIATLPATDIIRAAAAGWQPPLRFTAKAADGVTDLWGNLWLPHAYDPGGSYPLIDALYGGPQLTVAPRAFADLLSTRGAPPGRASLAALGCFVMTVDGRGTPGRDRAFREAGFGNFADVAIDDHAAVIEQLAGRYPAIDRARVGVIGHSFGGYVATRAMLRRPDLYRVGVASAAVHNWQGFRDAYRRYLGTPDYGDGRADKPAPDAVPPSHAALDNAALADRLAGRLLLAYGDMDENAMPASTLQFIDALIRAGKRYDLVYIPNGTHGFNATPYFVQRAWDYFVEHLLRGTPPADFRLDRLLEDMA